MLQYFLKKKNREMGKKGGEPWALLWISLAYVVSGVAWLIELHSGNQGRTEPKVSTIAEIATFESNYIMVLSTPYTQSFSLAFSP
jgi:hypothetical protein